jgi:hypothetical protein
MTTLPRRFPDVLRVAAPARKSIYGRPGSRSERIAQRPFLLSAFKQTVSSNRHACRHEYDLADDVIAYMARRSLAKLSWHFLP